MPNIDVLTALSQIALNRIFLLTVFVFAFAQVVKVMVYLSQGKKFNFRWLIGTGGMPSSHAAGSMTLATSCGIEHGFDSAIFALASSFAMVTMFDAQGVRRSTGEQAEILNKLLDDMYWHKKIDVVRIREFVGHTPFQVLVGAVLGFLVTILYYM